MTTAQVNKFLILSHHPKDRSISPCTTIYNVFLGDNAAYPAADHIDLRLPEKQVCLELELKCDRGTILLFNGCNSLLEKNSLLILNFASSKNIPVIIYWHEMAWQLNKNAAKSLRNWKRVLRLLSKSDIYHWVPSSQAKQLIMYIFQCVYEDVLVVYEAIDLHRIQIPESNHHFATEIDSAIKIAGSGLPSPERLVRKGVDYFCYIAQNLPIVGTQRCEYNWFGAEIHDLNQLNLSVPANCQFFAFVDNFVARLQSYDLFLLTSRDDPSPIVAFEALASNLPVFCFDSGGIAEIVPAEFVAFTPEQMIQNVLEYWTHKDKYPPLFFRNIANQYSPEKFVNKIMSGFRHGSLNSVLSKAYTPFTNRSESSFGSTPFNKFFNSFVKPELS